MAVGLVDGPGGVAGGLRHDPPASDAGGGVEVMVPCADDGAEAGQLGVDGVSSAVRGARRGVGLR